MYVIRHKRDRGFYEFDGASSHLRTHEGIEQATLFPDMEALAQHFGRRARPPLEHKRNIIDHTTEVVEVKVEQVPRYVVGRVLE